MVGPALSVVTTPGGCAQESKWNVNRVKLNVSYHRQVTKMTHQTHFCARVAIVSDSNVVFFETTSTQTIIIRNGITMPCILPTFIAHHTDRATAALNTPKPVESSSGSRQKSRQKKKRNAPALPFLFPPSAPLVWRRAERKQGPCELLFPTNKRQASSSSTGAWSRKGTARADAAATLSGTANCPARVLPISKVSHPKSTTLRPSRDQREAIT